MRIGMVALISILLSGCAGLHSRAALVAPCGASDYIETEEGNKILDVKLPTDENKTYTVVTPKNGFWMSLECHNRLEKGK